MKIKQITSTAEAVALVLGESSEFGRLYVRGGMPPVWFRGQPDAEWKLEPAVFRKNVQGNYIYDEYQMLLDMRLMRPLETEMYPTTFDWLVMCQHYRLPTRLLDWSESILVALLFAADNDMVDGALFALKPAVLNEQVSLLRQSSLCPPTFPDVVLRAEQAVCSSMAELLHGVHERYDKNGYYGQEIERCGGDDRLKEVAPLPIAVYPPRNNPRIIQQSGVFTLHGGAVPSLLTQADYGDTVGLEEIERKHRGILVKVSIPAEAKLSIRTDLARLGIHRASLFPDFESQALYLREKWS